MNRKILRMAVRSVVPFLVLAAVCGWNSSDTSRASSQAETSVATPNSLPTTKQEADEPLAQDNQVDDPSLGQEKRKQTAVQMIYSSKYLIDLGGIEQAHPFDIHKYKKIVNQLVSDGLLTVDQVIQPEPLTRDELLLVHTPAYLETLRDKNALATYLEAPELRLLAVDLYDGVVQKFITSSGGTLQAARSALEHGIAINIGGGYHHAKPTKGEGFCIIADVPIAIRKLQAEQRITRAVVIDVDVHQGNGTAVCLADDPSTFTFSMHERDIYPIPKETSDWDIELESGMQDEEYLKLLSDSLPKIFEQFEPQICFIVAGCDTLAGDPLANLEMTHAGIIKRDEMIVAACVQRNIPVVFTLSGGYSRDAWSAQYKSVKNLIEKFDEKRAKE